MSNSLNSSTEQDDSSFQQLPNESTRTTTTASSSSSSSNHTAVKKVSFALPITGTKSSTERESELNESLLAGSFTHSTFDLAHPNNSVPTSDPIHLTTMSDQRLIKDPLPKYSSLAQGGGDTSEDDDGPPPLEPAVHPNHQHGSSSCSGGDHHGHSHGSNSNSRRGTECDNVSHIAGLPHAHSHGGRNTRTSPSTPSTPGTPRRSPVDNCGGLKNRKKETKAAEANRAARRQLGWAAVCCCIFMICEVIGGFIANSLAIMTDAAHLLSDLAGFLISIFALWLATRPATSRLSFGFHRAEILGALISVLLIWLLTGILVYEACWRLAHPEDVDGKIMFIVAGCGLVVNFGMGMILMQSGHGHSHGLGGGHDHDHGHSHGPKKSSTGHTSLNSDDDHHGHSHGPGESHAHTPLTSHHNNESDHLDEDSHGHEENLNVKAAFIHVLGDALQSVGVMIAAGLIWYNPEWRIADPLCTFVFSILVLFTTTRLIRQSVGVLMEGVPDGIDPDEVEESLLAVSGVIAVHDLHIWSLSVGKPSLSVHLYCRDDAAHVLTEANKMCAERYNIHHSTIQVERQHDEIDCNDAFIPGHANLDRITSANFAQLGLQPEEV